MKNESLQSMKRIKLLGMAAAYEAILSLPVNQQPTAHDMIARLIDAEAQHRSHRRTELFLRLSKLRYQATITDIECCKQKHKLNNFGKYKLNRFRKHELNTLGK